MCGELSFHNRDQSHQNAAPRRSLIAALRVPPRLHAEFQGSINSAIPVQIQWCNNGIPSQPSAGHALLDGHPSAASSNDRERVHGAGGRDIARYSELAGRYRGDARESDIMFSQGVLKIDLGEHGTWVINRQVPNRQIWWSSPVSGPRRYEYDAESGHWVNTRDKGELSELCAPRSWT
ncbi:Frataxin conserved site [Phytophthora cactorum]|nr:Frataxin conserved site [Phytophthora cactorum]